MARLTVTLSANAGVVICAGNHRIWVDALHEDIVPGYSRVGPQLQARMLNCPEFQNPEWIVYTHCHGDHFSQTLTQSAIRLWPQAKLVLPEKRFPEQILLTGETVDYDLDDLHVRFIRLTHEGSQYADVPHYGILLRWQGKHVLLPGDCQLESLMLAEAVADITVDAAILDFPWLTKRSAREFTEVKLRPTHWFAYHLPFEGDDINGYRSAVYRAAGQIAGEVHILDRPLQTVHIEL